MSIEIQEIVNGIDSKTGNPVAPVQPSSDTSKFILSSKGEVIRYSDLIKSLNAGKDIARFAETYPGPYDVHVNRSLSDFAVSYEIDSEKFIAPKMAPIYTTQNRSDIYFSINRDDVVRNYGTLDNRGIGATANEVEQGFSQSTFTCIDRALRSFLPDKIVQNADQALQLTQQYTKFITDVINFNWDKRVISSMTGGSVATGTFASLTNGGTGTVATATQTNPYIQQVFNAVKYNVGLNQNGTPPNVVLVNSYLATQLAASPEIRAQVIYSLNGGEKFIQNGGVGTNPLCWGLPDSLYGCKVVVVSTPNNTAQKGKTATPSVLLPQGMVFATVDQPSLRTLNSLTTFRFGGLDVRTYRDESRRGTYIEVEADQVENITNLYGLYSVTSAGV